MGCLIWLLQEYIIPCRDTLLSNSIYKRREGEMGGGYRWGEGEIVLAQLMGVVARCLSSSIRLFNHLSVCPGSSGEVHWWRRRQCRVPGEISWHAPVLQICFDLTFHNPRISFSRQQCPLNCPAGPKGPQGIQGVKVGTRVCFKSPWG